MKNEMDTELTDSQTERIAQYNFLTEAIEIMTLNERIWFMTLGTTMLFGGITITDKQLNTWNNIYAQVKTRWDEKLRQTEQMGK